jgi:hypothetical protein
VRIANAHLARAKTSAAKLAQSVSDLAKTIDFIEGISSDPDQARSEVQSEVGSRNNGGPPLDEESRRWRKKPGEAPLGDSLSSSVA